MLRLGSTLGFSLLLAAGIMLSAGTTRAQTLQPATLKPASTAPAPVRTSKAHSRKPAPVAEVPQAPAAPPTLEEQPPVPPQVSYRNGQLTIDAANATLAQVLHSVQSQTGASVDIPPGAGNERVVATLGPGKPKDVLANLLNGSKFDYVLLGEANNPGAVQKVILLARTSSVANASQIGVHPSQPQQAVEPPEDEYPQNEPEVESPAPLTPGQPGFPGGEQLTPDTNNAQPNPGGRTPEQMLQELQRMQQQQQQMQQQLNPANQTPLPGQSLSIRPNN
jgi:hypothetical protein